jgi:hypothetical protein
MNRVVVHVGKKTDAALIGVGIAAAGAVGAALAHEPTRKRIIGSLSKLRHRKAKDKGKPKRGKQ